MFKKIFALVIIPVIGFVSLGGGVVNAQLSNQQNGYLIDTDGGSTDQIAVIGAGTGQQDAFVNVVRGAINWVLGVLALIALIILLYGGFMMVTASGNEDRYKSGFTILRQAAIGLILIGIAWFVISIIFWLTSIVGLDAEGQAANTNS